MITASLKHEIDLRLKRISDKLGACGIDALLVSSNANLYYTSGKAHTPKAARVLRLPPGGRDALRKYAGGIFLAKAGSKLCLRPGPKAGAGGD